MSEFSETVADVGDWVWGLIQGNFNEQQTISQIIVDAVIGCIPVVGDVTAARDLIAVIIRLVEHPDKRDDVLEWVQLVVLCFALIPVAGGVIKGVGKLLLRVGQRGVDNVRLLQEIVQLVRRFGGGDAVAWVRNLNFETHIGAIRAKFSMLVNRLNGALNAVKRRFRWVLPNSMMARIDAMINGITDLGRRADAMIPQAIRELNRRLRLVQANIYQGEFRAIPSSLVLRSRAAEARLVEVVEGGQRVRRWRMTNPPNPQSTLAHYRHRAGWPDLRHPPWAPNTIPSFSGPITAKWLPPGTKIRRVIVDDGQRFRHGGQCWMYELPRSGTAWRKDFAVLERWNTNGAYIEFTVPPGGIHVWEGKVSSQIDSDPRSATYGQFLEGGATQLVVSKQERVIGPNGQRVELDSLLQALTPRPTNFTGLRNINVPGRTATVQTLGRHEGASRSGPGAQVVRGAVSAANRDND